VVRRALLSVPVGSAALGLTVVAPDLSAVLVGDLGEHRLVLTATALPGARVNGALAHTPSVPRRQECLDGQETHTVQRMEGTGMVEPSKITDKAAEIAAQIAAAAGPAKEKATELAATAAAAAAPLAAQAKGKAAGLAERAGEVGAKGVSALAEGLDKATGGKYSDRISSVTSKLEDRLDPGTPTDTPPPPPEPAPTT
jgi:hypothetical protein